MVRHFIFGTGTVGSSLEPVPVRGGPEPRFRFRYWYRLPTLPTSHAAQATIQRPPTQRRPQNRDHSHSYRDHTHTAQADIPAETTQAPTQHRLINYTDTTHTIGLMIINTHLTIIIHSQEAQSTLKLQNGLLFKRTCQLSTMDVGTCCWSTADFDLFLFYVIGSQGVHTSLSPVDCSLTSK